MQNLLKGSLMLLAFCLFSCEKLGDADKPASSPEKNFEYLWTEIRNKYSFFELKHVNWDSVYQVYKPLVRPGMSQTELFDVLASMMNELRDGHVNLSSNFNVSRYLPVFFNSPENFDRSVVMRNYLGTYYYTTGPFLHNWADSAKKVAYIYYGSFSSSFSTSQLDFIADRYASARGIILDIRNNGGGAVTNMIRLASAVADESRHVYTTYVKSGPGASDFTKSEDFYINPVGKKLSNKIIVLTNRNSFSATSYFSMCMKAFPHVMQLGDTTGGGTGAPGGGELPNGWAYRFSCTYSLTPGGNNFENGVPPDSVVWLNPANLLLGKDDIIDAAVKRLE